MKKALKIVLIVFLACLLVIGAGAGYHMYKDFQKAKAEVSGLEKSKSEAAGLVEKQEQENETLSENIKSEKENNQEAIELQESWERIKEKLQKALQ